MTQCTWLECTSMHTKHTRNRCEVNSTGEHLLPLLFFKMPNWHTAILKWEFGIGLRDKQKLNLEGKCQKYIRGKGCYLWPRQENTCLVTVGDYRGREGSYGWLHRAMVWEPHLECCLSQLQEMMDEMMMPCQCFGEPSGGDATFCLTSLTPSWVWCWWMMCWSFISGLLYLLHKSCHWCTCGELWDVPWIGLPHTSCWWSWWWPFPANNRWLLPSTRSHYLLPNPSWVWGWV